MYIFQTHFGFTNLGSKVFRSHRKAISFGEIWSWTPCSTIFFCLRQLSPRECKEKGSKGRRLPKHQWSLDVALVNLEYTCVLGYFLCCKEIDYKKQPSNPIWPIKTIHYPKEHHVENACHVSHWSKYLTQCTNVFDTEYRNTGDINVL